MVNETAIKLEREAVQKCVLWQKEISMRGGLTITAFSTQNMSRGWQQELLFVLTTEGG